MRRPTQGCLFESDRPHWNELLTSTQEGGFLLGAELSAGSMAHL